MSLTFDAAAHEYRWHGVVRPSVTQCLSGLQDFGMVPADVLAAACERGTDVHALCQYHDEGDLDASSIGDYAGYVDAWMAFVSDHKAKWTGIESMHYSERYGYAGTMDRYGHLGAVPHVIDIKTGAAPHRTWGLQTAAYRQLLAEQVDPKWLLARRATVQLRANGTYKFLPWDSPQDWPVFLALLTLMNWSNA